MRLQAIGKFEYVGRKPLGDGLRAIPVREMRGSLLRSFAGGKWDAGVNFQLASGFTGQTLETLQLEGEPAPFERVVGVKLKSYASLSLTYHFGNQGLR